MAKKVKEVTSAQVVDFLLEKGFVEYKDSLAHSAETRHFQLVDRSGRKWDEEGENKHFTNVHLYDEVINGHVLKGVSIDKCFASKALKGRWAKVEIYGIEFSEFLKEYKKYQKALDKQEALLKGEGQ